MSDPRFFAEQIGEWRRMLAGVLRRMAVKLTDGGVWQVAGHILFGDSRETRTVELFPGIGIYARPPIKSESAEAIVANAGGQNGAVIIATRDEETRAKVNDVDYDESTLYNSVARVHVKDDGTIELRTHGGTAVTLAKHSELKSLRDYVNNQFAKVGGHTHVVAGAATTTITSVAGSPEITGVNGPIVAPANPTGTQKTKGE